MKGWRLLGPKFCPIGMNCHHSRSFASQAATFTYKESRLLMNAANYLKIELSFKSILQPCHFVHQRPKYKDEQKIWRLLWGLKIHTAPSSSISGGLKELVTAMHSAVDCCRRSRRSILSVNLCRIIASAVVGYVAANMVQTTNPQTSTYCDPLLISPSKSL